MVSEPRRATHHNDLPLRHRSENLDKKDSSLPTIWRRRFRVEVTFEQTTNQLLRDMLYVLQHLAVCACEDDHRCRLEARNDEPPQGEAEWRENEADGANRNETWP
jgi:hypothetical protein